MLKIIFIFSHSICVKSLKLLSSFFTEVKVFLVTYTPVPSWKKTSPLLSKTSVLIPFFFLLDMETGVTKTFATENYLESQLQFYVRLIPLLDYELKISIYMIVDKGGSQKKQAVKLLLSRKHPMTLRWPMNIIIISKLIIFHGASYTNKKAQSVVVFAFTIITEIYPMLNSLIGLTLKFIIIINYSEYVITVHKIY